MSKKMRNLLIAALLLAGVLSLFASSAPDGYERVLHDFNVAPAEGLSLPEVMPDYQVPWIQLPWLSGSLAGIFGTLITGAVAWGLSHALAAKKGRTGEMS